MASIASKTLAVNAAFLQEIKDDHHELRELQRAAREIASDRRPSIDRLAEILSELRDRVSLHFALEEAYGYCEAGISESPWLSGKASALKSQHVDLFLTLSKRVNEAEGLRYHETPPHRLGTLCESVLEFCDQLDEHERAETELILTAFDDDVGVGD